MSVTITVAETRQSNRPSVAFLSVSKIQSQLANLFKVNFENFMFSKLSCPTVTILWFTGDWWHAFNRIWLNFSYGFYHWRRDLLKVRGGHFANCWSDFLLQKLQSYGEALNLRGAMAPWPPYFHHLRMVFTHSLVFLYFE